MPLQARQMGYNGQYRQYAAVIGIDADTPRMAIRKPIRGSDLMTGRRVLTGRHDLSATAGRLNGPTGDEGSGQGADMRYDIG